MKKDFIFKSIDNLKGVGPKLSKYLKKKRIEKIKDVILNLPYSETDRSKIYKLKDLEIGKIQTVKVQVKKLNFPRIRNLPNKISCEDETGKIEIVYFNSREGYLRKLFRLNEFIIVSGKINYFNKKYQITNPDYVTTLENEEYVARNIPKYNLTKGINEKKYRNISEQVINNLPKIDEWLDENFIIENKLINWNESIRKLHTSKDGKNNQSKSFRRLVFDELCANFLTLSENRKRIKINKSPKIFTKKNSELVKKSNEQKVLLAYQFEVESFPKNTQKELTISEENPFYFELGNVFKDSKWWEEVSVVDAMLYFLSVAKLRIPYFTKNYQSFPKKLTQKQKKEMLSL